MSHTVIVTVTACAGTNVVQYCLNTKGNNYKAQHKKTARNHWDLKVHESDAPMLMHIHYFLW